MRRAVRSRSGDARECGPCVVAASAGSASPLTQARRDTGELLVFGYGTHAPYFALGVLDRSGAMIHEQPSSCPARASRTTRVHRASRSSATSRCSGSRAARARHPSPALVPALRRGSASSAARGPVRWFEAAPTTSCTSSRVRGRHHDRPRRLLPDDPMRSRPGRWPWRAQKMVDIGAMGSRRTLASRLATGASRGAAVREISEFPSINGRIGGRRHRYVDDDGEPAGSVLRPPPARPRDRPVQQFAWPMACSQRDGDGAAIGARRRTTATRSRSCPMFA